MAVLFFWSQIDIGVIALIERSKERYPTVVINWGAQHCIAGHVVSVVLKHTPAISVRRRLARRITPLGGYGVVPLIGVHFVAGMLMIVG